MAKDDQKGSAQPDATASVVPAEDKQVYFNTTQSVHPRHHQPADPKEADRVNKAASDRNASSDEVAATFPKEVPDPKEAKMSARDANEQASDLNAKNK